MAKAFGEEDGIAAPDDDDPSGVNAPVNPAFDQRLDRCKDWRCNRSTGLEQKTSEEQGSSHGVITSRIVPNGSSYNNVNVERSRWLKTPLRVTGNMISSGLGECAKPKACPTSCTATAASPGVGIGWPLGSRRARVMTAEWIVPSLVHCRSV